MSAQDGPASLAARQRLSRLLAAPTAFPHDDGSVDPGVGQALAEDDEHLRLEGLVAALDGGRVLIGLQPHSRQRQEGCGTRPRAGEDEPAVPSVVVADGRRALPVFTGVVALTAWRPEARPVPVASSRAARLARREADGLWLVDPGTLDLCVPRSAVAALARERRWVPPWRDDPLLAELGREIGAVPGVGGVRIEPGRGAALRVLVQLGPEGAAQVGSVLARCGRVVSDPAWAERLDAVELCPLPPLPRPPRPARSGQMAPRDRD